MNEPCPAAKLVPRHPPATRVLARVPMRHVRLVCCVVAASIGCGADAPSRMVDGGDPNPAQHDAAPPAPTFDSGALPDSQVENDADSLADGAVAPPDAGLDSAVRDAMAQGPEATDAAV